MYLNFQILTYFHMKNFIFRHCLLTVSIAKTAFKLKERKLQKIFNFYAKLIHHTIKFLAKAKPDRDKVWSKATFLDRRTRQIFNSNLF